MDPLFQSLLFASSSISRDNAPGDAASNANGSNAKLPRASRYAQLIPREALRPTSRVSPHRRHNRGHERPQVNHGNKSTSVASDEVVDESFPNIRVYKMDGSTGLLELLPQDDYSVVCDSDHSEKEHDSTQNQGILEIPEVVSDTTYERSVHDVEEDDIKINGDQSESMNFEVTNNEECRSEATPPPMIHSQSSSSNLELENEDILYIVHSPRKNYPSKCQERVFQDSRSSYDADDYSTTTSTTSVDEQTPSIFLNSHHSKSLPSDRIIEDATNTAQILVRALTQRIHGFDKLRPKFGLDEEEEEEEKRRERSDKRGKITKQQLSLAGTSTTTEGIGASSDAFQEKKGLLSKDDDETDDEGNNIDCPSVLNNTKQEEKIMLHSLLSQSNIIDGDDERTLMRLTKMRIWQESNVSPDMQGINLEDWEDGIDWEGAVESDENDENSTKKSESLQAIDCTEDYRPPQPKEGYTKRLRRMPQHTDRFQILRETCNPRLEALDLSATVNWEGACSDTDDDEHLNVPLILQSTVAGKSVSSILAPIPASRPPPFESLSIYQQRYERDMASEITSTAELSKGGIFGENEALERYKEMRQRKREKMAKDKQNRVTEVMSSLSLSGTGRRITSSLMGPGGAERTGRPNRHAMGSSSAHDVEYVEQLELVYTHSLVKPDLTLSEYRQFHRPRLPLAVVTPNCRWQFQTVITAQNKKDARGIITAADGSTVVGSYHAMMSAGNKSQSKIRNEADLSSSTGDLVILEYSEERPPLVMTKGMTCRIVNYYRGDRARCPISAGGGDRPLRKRHGDKAASSKGPETKGSSGRIERPPRLFGPNQYSVKSAADLLEIIGSSSQTKNKEAACLEAKKTKEIAIDILPEGVTEVLHQKVHGPFIGEVEEGKTQTGLISNLFAASMFQHNSQPTDFLMVLRQLQDLSPTVSMTSKSSNTELGVVLRPFPAHIFCVGQTEPRVKVFAPNTNDEKKFINAFIPYQVAKNIERTELREGRGLTFDDIRDRLFANTTIPQTQLRLRIKQVANFERSNSGIWNLKAIGEDDFPGVEALGRKVSPEGVAAYESQCAAIRRLQDLGLNELLSGGNNIANVAMVMIFLNGAVQGALERKMKMKKVLDIKKRQKSPTVLYFEKAVAKLDMEHKEIKRRHEIAKFIYQELQLTPWHLSGEFIDVHKRAQGSAMMKLTGIGDPSGLGEAFNFLREDEKKPNSVLAPNSDGALNAQIKKITGTENDLRKLTMKQMASLLRSYGMKDKQISVLKRWDRVHVIRDLSTKAASDGMGDELERFARGEKLRLSDQRENYKKRVQEIWRRQVAALSSDALNETTARSDVVMSSAKDLNDAEDESDGCNVKNSDSDDSDDEEDEFAALMEMEMTSTGEANRLMAAQLGDVSMRTIGRTLDAQELSKEARELATLQREREEMRAMHEGLQQKGRDPVSENTTKRYQKVIRRKVTKTQPDGSQTVTFEFIVNKGKVDECIARLRNHKDLKKNIRRCNDDISDQGTCPGHAFFEERDNARATGRRSVKLKIKKETHIIHKKISPFKKESHIKFMSMAKQSRIESQELRKKKRKKLQEEADLYKTHHRTKGTSNRKERGAARDRMPHVILSDRLEVVRAQVETRPRVGPFLKPVPRDQYPSYYESIHEPIDLQTIREKNRKYDYKTADSFVRDFELMKRNAIKFNGKASQLASEAIEIHEFVKSTVEQNREEFDQMEEAVQDQIDNGKRRRKAKTALTKTKIDAPTSKPVPMNTANVVLDGVETQVNLGTNLSFGFGEDSDSDAS